MMGLELERAGSGYAEWILAKRRNDDIIETGTPRWVGSSIGGEWLRPDRGEAGGMPRTPVGLVNHPVPMLLGNYQLRMAA
jgi:hypothetical protein